MISLCIALGIIVIPCISLYLYKPKMRVFFLIPLFTNGLIISMFFFGVLCGLKTSLWIMMFLSAICSVIFTVGWIKENRKDIKEILIHLIRDIAIGIFHVS